METGEHMMKCVRGGIRATGEPVDDWVGCEPRGPRVRCLEKAATQGERPGCLRQSVQEEGTAVTDSWGPTSCPRDQGKARKKLLSTVESGRDGAEREAGPVW